MKRPLLVSSARTALFALLLALAVALGSAALAEALPPTPTSRLVEMRSLDTRQLAAAGDYLYRPQAIPRPPVSRERADEIALGHPEWGLHVKEASLVRLVAPDTGWIASDGTGYPPPLQRPWVWAVSTDEQLVPTFGPPPGKRSVTEYSVAFIDAETGEILFSTSAAHFEPAP